MSRKELDDVLKAPEQQLRAILRAVCNDEDVFVPDTNRTKRKATSDVRICVQCDEPFTEGSNEFDDFYYHPEDLVPDYDNPVWADHDERCLGTINSDWCRKEYPYGYMWECWGKPGPALGRCRDKYDATDGVKRVKEVSRSNKIRDIVNLVSDDEEN